MAKTYVFVLGHGGRPNGGFDIGCSGIWGKGEWVYFNEVFIPSLIKKIPNTVNYVILNKHDYFYYGDLIENVKKYENPEVIELHFDGASPSASGGHVIVNVNFTPDSLDLKLRDWLSETVGIRYSFKGNKGISGRGDLFNCNLCKSANISYRMVEAGFGTNSHDWDIMYNKVDEFTTSFCKHVFGSSKDDKPKNGWAKDTTGWYYVKGGYYVYGWEKISETWYYFNKETGYMLSNEWLSYGGAWYYLKKDGSMCTDWELINGKWYLFKKDGEMIKNTFTSVTKGTSYLGKDGAMLVNEWLLSNGKWYYFNHEGVMIKKSLEKVKDSFYAFGSDGAMLFDKEIILVSDTSGKLTFK